MTMNPTGDAYPLRFPFETPGGALITELKLRRAKAKDIVAIERAAKNDLGNTAVTLAFLASVNGLDPSDLEDIDADDLLDISERVVGFLPERLRMGLEA